METAAGKRKCRGIVTGDPFYIVIDNLIEFKHFSYTWTGEHLNLPINSKGDPNDRRIYNQNQFRPF